MYLDFLNYQKFYNSSIGKLLANHIEFRLKKYCYLYDNQNIGCFGYSLPYLNFLKITIYHYHTAIQKEWVYQMKILLIQIKY